MKQRQIIVTKDRDGSYWFTLQERRVYFLFRGWWHNVRPICQPTYNKAMNL